MGMKNAFDSYFKKQREFWQSNYSTFPKVPYNKSIDGRMIIENSLNDGYVQWQPVPQDKSVDFSVLEKKLNLTIHPRIVQYFTSYWFLSVVGNVADSILEFTPIPYGIDILRLAEDCYEYGIGKFPSGVHFELGSALIEDDDNYLLYVDNDSAFIKCLQPEDKTFIPIGSLEETITVMKADM